MTESTSLFEIMFWWAVAMVGYTYGGYPLILKVLSLVRRRPVRRSVIAPRVSFIITAHNEEGSIAGKLENTLALEYPREKLEIIVASDCSTDRTDEIVRGYASRGVKHVRVSERRGKEHAQRSALAAASGEMMVFSDVATVIEPRGVSRMVENFADPTVGCVSSVDRFVDAEGRISGEGAYVRYEMWLRALESDTLTLVGMSGSWFAARRTVCDPWASGLPSDFSVVVNAVRQGLRAVCDPMCVGYYRNIRDETQEFRRKVRTVVRGLAVLMRSPQCLNPFVMGWFAVQLASHKLCRWLVPVFLIAALVSNAALVRQPGYALTLLVEVAFFLSACIGFLGLSRAGWARFPAFFLSANAAIVLAWVQYLSGRRVVVWEPSKRVPLQGGASHETSRSRWDPAS